MKQIYIKWLRILIIVTLLLNMACKSDIPDLITGEYYESSTLKRWNLKGNVKSVSINNSYKIFEFNKEGFVSKIIINELGEILIHEYNYDNDKNLQSISMYLKEQPQFLFTKTFTYDKTGRLVLRYPRRLVTNFSAFNTDEIINELVLGLSSETKQTSQLNYYFVDDTMYLCRRATINDTLINDTTKVTYVGKYPVSYTVFDPFTNKKTIYKDIFFSNFGNIFHFTEESQDSVSNISKRTFYYKPDNPSMLLDSIVYEYGTSRIVDKYLYNSHMDLYQNQIGGGDLIWEFDYRYDSRGNWTKKTTKSRSNNSANWENGLTTTRVIRYW